MMARDRVLPPQVASCLPWRRRRRSVPLQPALSPGGMTAPARPGAAAAVATGTTGHRALVGARRLSTAIDRGLDRIEGAWPGRALLGFSPLAEGAARPIAERILARGGQWRTWIRRDMSRPRSACRTRP